MAEIWNRKNTLTDERVQESSVDFTAWVVRRWAPKYLPVTATFGDIRNGVYHRRMPITYRQLADMYLTKIAVLEALSSIQSDDDLDTLLRIQEEKEKSRVNQTGEVTLAKIGEDLGDITPTQVKNIGDAAQRKFAGFAVREENSNGVMFTKSFTMDPDLFASRAEAAINKLCSVLSAVIAKTAKNMDFDIDDVFDMLTDESFLTPGERLLVKESEYVALYLLMERIRDGEIEDVKRLMLDDLVEEDNILKSLQNINAKLWFPPAKRGRPLGSTNKSKDNKPTVDQLFAN